ncbi:Squalene/phytoene synthase-domain-containing protein [Hypoxylon sp. FL1150]|nr:Squalene/phytoene synthase-domain-containing protein [Hypoxylon sp. FL1150]
MAYDYALVHFKYTIPFAGLLTFILRPLLTKLDLCKTATLILVAFFATLPWDSYLIRHGVWTYPPNAIVGPRLFGVPAEELFFFVIQTYITSMLYILLNKPILHAQFITNRADSSLASRRIRTLGQVFLAGCIATGAALAKKGGEGTYLGLILVWACPFALLTWSLSGYFLIKLPIICVATPIVVPTAYLWVVDEFALGRGTWAIESGTKLGWRIWGSLELEEAVFFVVTNTLIVFGLAACDRGLAVLYTFPERFPNAPQTPSLTLLMEALFMDPAKYDMVRVEGIREAVGTLRRKSRSFYLASSVFPGRLRIDLVLLYSFCRVADDLVDEARTENEALEWINKLSNYLGLVYGLEGQPPSSKQYVNTLVERNFPRATRSALELLPTELLSKKPLYELLEGFKMDLSFADTSSEGVQFPIKDEADLETYAHRVASTVGELCLWLVFHHCDTKLSKDEESTLVFAAQTMGHALQYVNIARDILVDAEMGRVYLPINWLKAENLTPNDIVRDPKQPKVEKLRQKLLDRAFKEYGRSRDAMNILPSEVRGPLIVAVESYMEIGRVLQEKTGVPSNSRKGRATVPRVRRIWVAWKNLSAA